MADEVTGDHPIQSKRIRINILTKKDAEGAADSPGEP